MRLLQELFGRPSGVQILAAVIAKHPTSSMPPEPIIFRVNARLVKDIYLQKDKSTWQICNPCLVFSKPWLTAQTTVPFKKMLHQAGVPLHILAFVVDAVGACETCRAYANTAAKPLIKLSADLAL